MNPLKHVAIIMDGNGRWGLKHKKSRNAGHKAGLETVEKIIKETIKNKISFLTLYAFSTENWKRPKKEIDYLFNLLEIFLKKRLNELHKQNINDWCCEFVGNGPTIQFCIDYINKNNIPNIKFTDKIPHKDLNIFYNNLSLFVLPSYYEALGCVYLESWATNTPFIAIKEQGIEEILNDNLKQKFLIEKGDYLSLAKNINNLKNNCESITFDSKYDIENTISNFLYFIKNK